MCVVTMCTYMIMYSYIFKRIYIFAWKFVMERQEKILSLLMLYAIQFSDVSVNIIIFACHRHRYVGVDM